MNGNLWYEVAKSRVAERQQAARQAGEARQARSARGRHARDRAQAVVTPAIPDYAHEMFPELGDAVPAPRQAAGRHRQTPTSR